MNNEELDSAYSSIIGVLLLVTIVMVMGGIVSLVLTSQPMPDKVPIAYLSVSQSHERVELINKAGDTLTSKCIAIVVDGVDRTNKFRKPENSSDWGTLHAGEHIYYDSPQEPKSVQVLYVGNSGNYLLASSGPATSTPITIVPSPTPVPTIPVDPTPTVMQITPDSGYNNTSINTMNVTGTAFLRGATVTLNGTGFADIPATDVTVVRPVQISCSFNLTDVPAGLRNVVVTNSDGNQAMLVGGFRVDPAGARPIADFAATPTEGTVPLAVQFNDTSTSSPVSWEWTFGDGGISNIQNASHQYTNPGTYTVNLTATNADGSHSKIKTNYINVTSQNKVTSQNLVANFTSNITQIPVNGFVQFYDTSTNTPTHWQWTFGDDLFYDTHQNPVHQYINPGIFSVQLTVTNADGTDSEIKTDYIQAVKVNRPPVLTQIPNRTATVGIPLTFIITGSDPDNDHLTYSANGLPMGATFDPATRTFAWTPLYGDAGNFSSTFTVSDGTLTDSKTSRIMVTSQPKIPPTAQFTANTLQGQSPLTVQFTDKSVSAGTTSYQWDMTNDGVVDYTTRNPVHTYQTAGNYTVKLTVTNASGTDSEIKSNYIKVSFLQSGGETFGAESNPTGNPIGGGAGYNNIILRTDPRVKYVVTTKSQLLAALSSATSGQVVFVPSTATIDLTGETSSITIPAGVTLASDRGYAGSLGGLIKRDSSGSMPQGSIKTGGDNVRITGLRIQGPHPAYNGDYGDSVKGAIESYDHNNLEVDNCEIYYWSYCGVMSENSIDRIYLYVHHNYIHHIAGRGYGYGAGIALGSALFEANHFDYVRHAITGYGGAGESYEARYNLHGSHNLDSNYDVHAEGQNIGNWDGHTPSGRLYRIHHNTVPAAVDGYESIFYVAPPTEGMYIYNNRLGSGITPNGGWARCYMTNNYIDGVFHASGQ